MPSRWLPLLTVMLAATVVIAQPPQPPPLPQLDPVNNKLDAALVRWEQAMGAVASLHTKVTRTSIDKIFGTAELCEGEAMYLKPNKASIWLQNKKKADDFECLVCNGQIVYKWEPKLKEIHIHELPKPKQGQVGDDNFVSFMFGMKAAQAKTRYTLSWGGEDPFYIYIDVLPKDPSDKVEFTRARLVLTKSAHLPAQIWFEQPNGNETTWDFTKMSTNLQLNPATFNQPTPPQGWQIKKAPPQAAVVRPQM